jgi:Holliday junction DNA helicase RuvA
LIGRLHGPVVEESADGVLIIDVAGVGYEVIAPAGTLGRADPDNRGFVTLFIHTHVREDALLLYGFSTLQDRAAFRNLISVSNVGPRLALNVLSAMTAAELATAVVRGDATRLTQIPGIGKKTAQRLVLELKDKLLNTAPAEPVEPDTPRPIVGKPQLLRAALTRMGYKPGQAERAALALTDRMETAGLDELVREALKFLAK